MARCGSALILNMCGMLRPCVACYDMASQNERIGDSLHPIFTML